MVDKWPGSVVCVRKKLSVTKFCEVDLIVDAHLPHACNVVY